MYIKNETIQKYTIQGSRLVPNSAQNRVRRGQKVSGIRTGKRDPPEGFEERFRSAAPARYNE
jgi:hypothetical protein